MAVFQCLNSGDHVICIDDIYGGTQRILRQRVTFNTNIAFDFIDMSVPAKVAAAVRPTTKVVWIESPTNPTLKITDIRAIVDAVRAMNKDM
jgi:cystathionine gamma-lyase